MTDPYNNLVSPDSQSGTKEKGGTMGKGLLRSKTTWVSVITTLAGFGTWLSGSDIIADNPEATAVVGTAMGVLGIILRLLTKEPITSIK